MDFFKNLLEKLKKKQPEETKFPEVPEVKQPEPYKPELADPIKEYAEQRKADIESRIEVLHTLLDTKEDKEESH